MQTNICVFTANTLTKTEKVETMNAKFSQFLMHFALVSEHGDVYTFGDGSSGQLGCGNRTLEVFNPQLLTWSVPTKIVQVSCGEGHTGLVSGGKICILFHIGFVCF